MIEDLTKEGFNKKAADTAAFIFVQIISPVSFE